MTFPPLPTSSDTVLALMDFTSTSSIYRQFLVLILLHLEVPMTRQGRHYGHNLSTHLIFSVCRLNGHPNGVRSLFLYRILSRPRDQETGASCLSSKSRKIWLACSSLSRATIASIKITHCRKSDESQEITASNTQTRMYEQGRNHVKCPCARSYFLGYQSD